MKLDFGGDRRVTGEFCRSIGGVGCSFGCFVDSIGGFANSIGDSPFVHLPATSGICQQLYAFNQQHKINQLHRS